MISGGVVLEDNKRLQDQRVTNNSQILALMLSTDLDSQRVLQDAENLNCLNTNKSNVFYYVIL